MYNLDIPGWMAKSELQVIKNLASQVPSGGVIVELGSLRGRSAYAWATSCVDNVVVYCFDKFDGDFYEDFLENTKECKNIIAVKGECPYTSEYDGPPIDIFFLDGSHTNPQDIDAINYFLPHMKSGGIFCGHDYRKHFPDVLANVARLEQLLTQKVTLFPGTTIWAFRIP